MLAQLQGAATAPEAAVLEARIVVAWHAQQSPAVQLLAERAARAIAAGKSADALPDLDAAIELAPEQAELWRLRAEARGMNGDERGAMADLAQALSHNPADFPALRDASQLAESRGDFSAALLAWQRFLLLDPQSPGGAERLLHLQKKAQGEKA